MFAAIRSLVFWSVLAAFLRPRWKRLLCCLVIVLLAVYAHGEYLSYLRALPDSDARRYPIGWSYLWKHVAIVVGLAVAVVPELWNRARTQRKGVGAELDQSDVAASPDDALSPIGRKPELQSGAEQIIAGPTRTSARIESTTEELSAASDSEPRRDAVPAPGRGDVLDRLQRKGTLRTRAEQLLGNKR